MASERKCPKCRADRMSREYLSVKRDVLTCWACNQRVIDWKPRTTLWARIVRRLSRV